MYLRQYGRQTWLADILPSVCGLWNDKCSSSGKRIASVRWFLHTASHKMLPELFFWAHFLSLARSKLRVCSANHRAGYFSNLECDWLSIVWAYSERETYFCHDAGCAVSELYMEVTYHNLPYNFAQVLQRWWRYLGNDEIARRYVIL